MDSLLAASKYRSIPGFGDKKKGHIVLQDHSDTVWYRDMKIRLLPLKMNVAGAVAAILVQLMACSLAATRGP